MDKHKVIKHKVLYPVVENLSNLVNSFIDQFIENSNL